MLKINPSRQDRSIFFYKHYFFTAFSIAVLRIAEVLVSVHKTPLTEIEP